jgi:signal transduction histidine kinase
MSIAILTALIAGGLAWSLARRSRSARRDWLPDALRALAAASEPRELDAIVVRHVQVGLQASRIEWWHREDDGGYRGPAEAIAGVDARLLEAWVLAAVAWRRDDAADSCADVTRVLAATGAELVVPLRARGRALGMLVLGARTNRRTYEDRDLAGLAALADHLVLVTDRAQLAAQLDESRRMLQQATRLSTVGTLAAELAHEIRNPLVAVQTFLQLLPERLDDPEVTGDLRAVALTELQRVARLLNELLGMARASVATFASTDLEAVVEQVVRLLQVSGRKKDVELERTGEPLPNGAADASRLKQALVNVMLNAIQASPAGTRVAVTTRNLLDPHGRPAVEIAIADEGPGIPAEDRENVFHPFFTTKENGTGLGLPVTRQIVADHGGSIAVEDAAGRGARFVIRLPLLTPASERRDPARDARAA